MELKILKKNLKEGISNDGREYKIRSLFVSFTDENVYKKIVQHLKNRGIDSDTVEKFIKPNEYKGNISYAFGLNCSKFTFETVEKFGIIDAKVTFDINNAGYINARIVVTEGIEQVTSYTPPFHQEVSGWAFNYKAEEVAETEVATEPIIADEPELESAEDYTNDLPF